MATPQSQRSPRAIIKHPEVQDWMQGTVGLHLCKANRSLSEIVAVAVATLIHRTTGLDFEVILKHVQYSTHIPPFGYIYTLP